MRTPEEVDTLFSENELLAKINQVPIWTHVIDLGNKVKTLGVDHGKKVEAIFDIFPKDLTGKKVLDIGARDGKWSFEAERRNAKEIYAIDIWQHEGTPDTVGSSGMREIPFEICKEILDSKVQLFNLDVNDVEKLNKKFDIVLFLGVIYHLLNPFLAIQKIFNVCNEMVIVEGAILETNHPICYLLEEKEIGNDPSNKFLLSPTFLVNYAKDIGFKKAEFKGYCAASTTIISDEKKSENVKPLKRNRGTFLFWK